MISLASMASPFEVVLCRIPIFRRLLLRKKVAGGRPQGHDWWFEFGRQLYSRRPDLAVRLLSDLRGLNLPAEPIFMGLLTSIVDSERGNSCAGSSSSAPPEDGSDVLEKAIKLALNGCSRRVDPLLVSELRSRLERTGLDSIKTLEPSQLLALVGWPYGVAWSVIMRLFSEANDPGKAKRLREVASSAFLNWPSLVWIFLPKLTRRELLSWAQVAILDAIVGSGGWPLVYSLLKRFGNVSRDAANKLEQNGFSLVAAVLKVALARRRENPFAKATLLLEAGDLTSRRGLTAIAGLLYAEAVETLRPHVIAGAPVLELYHQALEKAASALMDSGLRHRAFRYWAELALSCAGLRESGLKIPGLIEREAKACFWMGELLSGRVPHEAAVWYLRASAKYDELGAACLSAEARKRASIEFLSAGNTRAAMDAVRSLQAPPTWATDLPLGVPTEGDGKTFFR